MPGFQGKQRQESTEAKDLQHRVRQVLQNSLVSVATRVLENTENNAQTATGDVVQFLTVNDYIAVFTFKNGCKTTFCLGAGSIVEGTTGDYNEPALLLVDCDVKHNFI